MYTYEVKDGRDCFVYLDGEVVEYAKHWDTEEGAHGWGAAMVEKLAAEAND
jgi:hypothetical protein